MCTGDTKKDRFIEHSAYKHTSQLSIEYTCEKESGRLQKKKDDRKQGIHKNVIPFVNIVTLCMNEELGLRKVNPIAEFLEKHDVLITPFWEGRIILSFSPVLARLYNLMKLVISRKVYFDLLWMRPPTLLFRSR